MTSSNSTGPFFCVFLLVLCTHEDTHAHTWWDTRFCQWCHTVSLIYRWRLKFQTFKICFTDVSYENSYITFIRSRGYAAFKHWRVRNSQTTSRLVRSRVLRCASPTRKILELCLRQVCGLCRWWACGGADTLSLLSVSHSDGCVQLFAQWPIAWASV